MSVAIPKRNEKWRYKPNRGAGTFTVVRADENTVTLRSYTSKDKTISLRTLHGDYEPVPR